MAGNALVEELIKSGSPLELHLLGEEKTPPYNRIYLADVLSGRKLSSQLYLKSYQRFEEEGVRLHLGERVERIFHERRLVVTSRGETIKYQKLVIATGSRPVLPPIRGLSKSGVFTFRYMNDVYRILEMERVSKRAVVIGGGLLGVECAKALRDAGLEVFLVHLLDVLMEKQLDKTASELLRRKLEEQGVVVLLGKRAEEVLGDRKVKGVRFSDGERLEADFIVVATGVKPNVELALSSGLMVNRGILVNDYLETSAQDVYAVGECIEHRGRTYGLLAPVLEQIKVCAKNLLHGNTERYEGSLECAVLKVAGVRLMSAGDVSEKEGEEVILYKDIESYRKAILREGRLTGFILYGNLAGSQNLLQLLQSGTPPQESTFLIKDMLLEEKELREGDIVCKCGAVPYGDILRAIGKGARTLEDLQKTTKAGTYCGSCVELVESILRKHVKEKPRKVNKVEEYKRDKHPFERKLIQKMQEWAKRETGKRCQRRTGI